MESRLGHDFSRVRVHTDARAAQSARAVHAPAFTVGQDVVFGAGQYSPGTPAGRRLLVHELAHVAQQSGAVIRRGGRHITLTKEEEFAWDVGILRAEMDRFDGLGSKEKLEAMERALQMMRRISANPLFADVDPDVRAEITSHIAAIEATLSAFAKAQKANVVEKEESNFSWAVVGGVAVLDGPEPGPADAVALIAALGMVLFAGTTIVMVTRDPDLVHRQAEALRDTLKSVRATLATTVLMAAVGNVIHDHIVDEARELAVALGLAATAAAVTTEVLCQMLAQLRRTARRADPEKWKKIISTEKGLGCRGSRANRE